MNVRVSLSRIAAASALAAAAAGAVAAPTGQQVYEGTCIACHGANGRGSLPGVPNLASPKGPLKGADEVIIKRMRDGYQSPGSPMAMPPKGGDPSLTDADLKAVLDYMRKALGR